MLFFWNKLQSMPMDGEWLLCVSSQVSERGKVLAFSGLVFCCFTSVALVTCCLLWVLTVEKCRCRSWEWSKTTIPAPKTFRDMWTHISITPAFCWRKTHWKKMLPTFFLLCCRCVVVMLNGPFPSDSSTGHSDPECLDESDKVCAQLLSFPSTKHFFFQPCLKTNGKLGTSIRFSGFFGISCLIPVVHHGFPQVRVKCTCDGGGALRSCGDTTVDGENPASVEFGSLF